MHAARRRTRQAGWSRRRPAMEHGRRTAQVGGGWTGRAPPPRTARDLRLDEQRIMFGYTCPAGGDQAHPICPPTRYFETHLWQDTAHVTL
jgi:hypothetical protein